MQMYQAKNLDCGFIILSSDSNIALLKTTVKSIKARYPDSSFINVASSCCNDQDIDEMKLICQTLKGGNSFSSLINYGMKNAKNEWNFVVMAGTTVRPFMDKKYSYFIDKETDILYPIIDNKMEFIESSINGFFVNKNNWKKIGDFGESGPFNIVKLLWGMKAVELGCQFKGVVGARFC